MTEIAKKIDLLREELQAFQKTFEGLSGEIPFGMTNDYMFHVVVQESVIIQIGLISSMLHIPKEEIKSVQIGNPIEPGKSMDEKLHVLDIKIILNDDRIINLEMQVEAQADWSDRSLQYLCREFDNTKKGEEYARVFPVTHVGIIDFDLFKGDEEFYAKYRLMNVKSHRIYNSKFQLNVLSLRQIENATEEDKAWGIDKWARLFKARRWEEIKMIGVTDEEILEVSRIMQKMNANETVRWECERREDAIRHERLLNNTISKQAEEIQKLQSEIEKLKSQIK